jgi:hypothetical protein
MLKQPCKWLFHIIGENQSPGYRQGNREALALQIIRPVTHQTNNKPGGENQSKKSQVR